MKDEEKEKKRKEKKRKEKKRKGTQQAIDCSNGFHSSS